MPTVYVILGDCNTRKSSTVRALTGVAQRKEVTVATNGGSLDIFVLISSLQESEITPQDFINDVTTNGYKNVLVTLWICPKSVACPSGSEYIRDFINAGWLLQHVVVLGAPSLPQHALPNSAPTPSFIPQSAMTPVNQVASQVRGWWGWL